MPRHLSFRAATLQLTGALIVLGTASNAVAQNQLDLTGVVRDFSSGHVDFNVVASAGNGHYAENIGLALGADNRPVFVGGGRKVTTEWTDAGGNPIASNLFNTFGASCAPATPGLAADGLVNITNSTIVDSFDSSLGPYGGANVGSAATVSTNSIGGDMLRNRNSSQVNGNLYFGPGGNAATVYDTSPNSGYSGVLEPLTAPVLMPTVTVPNLGGSVGNVMINSAQTITSDMHVDTLELRAKGDIVIDGNVTIVCENKLEMNKMNGSGEPSISLAAGATLEIYVMGDVDVIGEINFNTGDPSRCSIYKVGPGTLSFLNNASQIVANIVAPDGDLTVRQSSEVYGTFIGGSIDLDNNARFHMDLASVVSGGGGNPADNAGALGVSSSGGITSAASYNEWYRDVVGTNLSMTHVISLVLDGTGVYEYSTSSFHPIDDKLMGNEGDSYNHYFTYVIDARFVYEACNGQWLEFEGDDDAWMFIDGQLVMDLGGTAPGTPQRIDVDRLGLSDGQTYQVALFYAQRMSGSSEYQLRTNIPLATDAVFPTVSAAFD